MTKDALSEYSATATANTDIGGVNIDEGCPPSGINNAIREVMSHLKETDNGTSAITSPQITSFNLGHASDTTVARSAAGKMSVEGVDVTLNTVAQTLTNKTLTSPVINTGVSGTAILDSDTMSGASATTLSSSESIKAYVDTEKFSHTDTSSQASVNGSGRTYIQDITLDTYGHVTGLATATETVTDTNTTYTAGAGLDLSGTTFSLESDARGDLFYMGRDTNDYIGVETTQINFYLDGNLDMRLENDGDLHVDGNVVAYSTTTSDPRLKYNIKPVEDALEKVNKLNGYTFTYRSDGKLSAGILSTEVAEVLPSAVSQSKLPVKMGDKNEIEYDVVQYDQLHALLIEAIKTLTQRVEELEAK
jgi:hypothetical protein